MRIPIWVNVALPSFVGGARWFPPEPHSHRHGCPASDNIPRWQQ